MEIFILSMKLIDVIYESVLNLYEEQDLSPSNNSNIIYKNTKDDFIKQAKLIHDPLRKERGLPPYDYSKVKGIDINGTEYIPSNEILTIVCPIHGPFPKTSKAHITQKKTGCDKCGRLSSIRKKKKTTNQFIQQAQQVHKDENGNPLYSYDNTVYTGDANTVTITCPKHGDFPQRAGNHLNGRGCPVCNESKGEKSIKKYLQEKKLNNIPQMKFDGCFRMGEKTKRCFKLSFDFYLPDLKVLIEIDGSYHFQPILVEKEKFETRILRDKLKNEFAKNSGEIKKLIRIYYNNNINEVISELDRLLKDNSSNKIVLSSNYPKLGWNK